MGTPVPTLNIRETTRGVQGTNCKPPLRTMHGVKKSDVNQVHTASAETGGMTKLQPAGMTRGAFFPEA